MQPEALFSPRGGWRRKLRVAWRLALRRVRRIGRRARKAWPRLRATLWHRLYHIRFWCQVQIARRRFIATAVVLALAVGISAAFIPLVQSAIERLLPTEQAFQGLRTIFVTLGGALLGATAIVSSLVLFSMQVNVERMPHGLFRRLSGDRRLLGSFAGAYILAVSLAALSMVPDGQWAAPATLAACWTVAFILLLFLYGYRRALHLINPVRQLRIVTESAQQELRTWARRVERARPLLTPEAATNRSDRLPVHDLPRLAYFRANPHWTDGAKQAVRYAVSLARRYAELGDHEVSAAAMNAVLVMSAAYVAAKGNTFFTQELLLDNPLTTDPFLNDTLELLRQTARAAVVRRDEQQIEQTWRAFAGLVSVYAVVDYGRPQALKTHSHLAAGYLSAEVDGLLAQNMPDVLMEGARLMGQCASVLLQAEGPNGTATLVQKLGGLGCSGVARTEYQAVTLTCIEQLARLDFELLRAEAHDIHFAVGQLRQSISLIAKVFLAVPDTPLTSAHSTYLGPYYSGISSGAFLQQLAGLANAVGAREQNDKDAKRVSRNLKEWADGIYSSQKEILLEAIARRSHFAFDMIYWISRVTTILVFVSKTPACDQHSRAELQKDASWLISTLSFIPDDIETVRFVETFGITERLFETALEIYRRECPKVTERVSNLLVSWMFKAGRHASGWAILEKSIYGAATLALLPEADGGVSRLKAEVRKRVVAGELIDQEVADHAAREVRGRAAHLWRQGHWSSAIEHVMSQADPAELQPLLEELADIISPNTVGQAAREHFF
jgi:hypothetical protein